MDPEELLGWHGAGAASLASVTLVPRVLSVRFFFDRKATKREALLAWALVPRGLAAVVLAAEAEVDIAYLLALPG